MTGNKTRETKKNKNDWLNDLRPCGVLSAGAIVKPHSDLLFELLLFHFAFHVCIYAHLYLINFI